jgi:hypothetical protein
MDPTITEVSVPLPLPKLDATAFAALLLWDEDDASKRLST